MTRTQTLTYITALLIMLVGIDQAAVAQVAHYIPSDTTIGIWDPDSKTYTLTQDVSRMIIIQENNLILDGDGHTVSGGGVHASLMTGIVIKNIDIHGTGSGYGILLFESDSCTVTSSTVSNNDYGISVSNGSDNCTITDNIVSGSDAVGIHFWESDNCTITGNTVSGCSITALQFFGSCDFTATRNTITDNTWTFQIFPSPDSPSTGGQIYNNNFIENVNQWGTVVPFECDFYLPAPIGGNYWSDHTSPDTNGDGFVDVPYQWDNLPWTVQDGWLLPTVEDVLDFMGTSVEAGTLVGDGPGASSQKRLNALINMVEEAKRLIDEGLVDEACEQLADAYCLTDGESRPPDLVAGSAASELAQLIQCLMESM